MDKEEKIKRVLKKAKSIGEITDFKEMVRLSKKLKNYSDKKLDILEKTLDEMIKR